MTTTKPDATTHTSHDKAGEPVKTPGLTSQVIQALERDGWHVTPVCGTVGVILGIGRRTDRTGYDYVGTIDMRQRDPNNPEDWTEAAKECRDLFDPETEAVIWFGRSGAPALRAILDDFEGFADGVLFRLPDVVGDAVCG